MEGRGGYYETAGAMRDMIQNHLLQLCALVAIEPPAEWNPRAVRDEKVKALRAVRNVRWAGVPFYLRSGKRLSRWATEIIIEFKPAPVARRGAPTCWSSTSRQMRESSSGWRGSNPGRRCGCSPLPSTIAHRRTPRRRTSLGL